MRRVCARAPSMAVSNAIQTQASEVCRRRIRHYLERAYPCKNSSTVLASGVQFTTWICNPKASATRKGSNRSAPRPNKNGKPTTLIGFTGKASTVFEVKDEATEEAVAYCKAELGDSNAAVCLLHTYVTAMAFRGGLRTSPGRGGCSGPLVWGVRARAPSRDGRSSSRGTTSAGSRCQPEGTRSSPTSATGPPSPLPRRDHSGHGVRKQYSARNRSIRKTARRRAQGLDSVDDARIRANEGRRLVRVHSVKRASGIRCAGRSRRH